MAYMNKLSTEGKQRIVKSLNNSLNMLKEYYGLYKQFPDVEEFKKFKLKLEEIIPICKEYNIDYKAILTPDVCKFYGIE